MTRLPSVWLSIMLAVLLVLVAVAYLLYPGSGLQQPGAVRANEQEIAWLYPATASTPWNRFILALSRAEAVLARTQPGLRVRIDAATFPEDSATVPEAALEWPDGRRLLFRWYKTTSEQDLGHWLRALLQRRPPPLALLGGSTSDAAHRILRTLSTQAEELPPGRRPLMLLTTGTADRWVANPTDRATSPVDLTTIYPDRTFRFCFSNSQMAQATCDFVWSQPDLRPESDPAYLVHWLDDAYSRDLVEGYLGALEQIAVRATLEDQAWVLGCGLGVGVGPFPGGVLPLHRIGRSGSDFRLAVPHSRQLIDSSVGTFTLANRFEVEVSKYLLLDLVSHPGQSRPLLAVTGQLLPCRRFLREIVRSDPRLGQNLVVLTGDAVTFTTLYRDRRTHWPIQDLPFSLVAFAHQNPVDGSAGFVPEGSETSTEESANQQTGQAGTDDLLLLEEIVVALGLTCGEAGGVRDALDLSSRLRELRYQGGRIVPRPDAPRFFDARGNRATGTGEHLLCLRPQFQGDRVLPEATLVVYRRAGPANWQPIGEPLRVLYDKPDAASGDR